MSFFKKLKRTISNTVKSLATPEGLVMFAVMAASGGIMAPGFTFSQLGTAAFWKAGSISALKFIGLSAVATSLMPSPKSVSGVSGEDLGGRTVQASSPVSIRQVVYGSVRKSGVIASIGSSGTNNSDLEIVILISAAESHELTSIYINDAKVKANLSVSQTYQNADAPQAGDIDYRNYAYFKWVKGDVHTLGFDNSNSGWQERYDGITAIKCKLIHNTTKFPDGIPKISVVLKGKPVYDPRDGSTGWSNNPALCIRDYLLDNKYGVGCLADEIDEQSFEDAADACDVTAFSSAKYQLDGIVDTSKSPKSILNDMLTSCGGTLTYSNGKFKIRAAEYGTIDHTITESDIHGPVQLMTKTTGRDRFNAVKCIYYDDVFAEIRDMEVQESEFLLAQDNFNKKFVQISLPFTGFEIQAEILARLYLARARDQISFNCTLPLSKFGIDVGDLVNINFPKYSFNQKPFQCTSWNFAMQGTDLGIEASFKEITEANFGTDNVTQITTHERDYQRWSSVIREHSTPLVALGNRKRVRVESGEPGAVYNGFRSGFDTSTRNNWADPNIKKILYIPEGTDLYGITRYSYDDHSNFSGTGAALSVNCASLQGELWIYNFGRIIGGAGAGGDTDSSGDDGEDGGCAIRIENAPTNSNATVRIVNHGIIAGGGGGGGRGGFGATVFHFNNGYITGGTGGNGDYGAGWVEYPWPGTLDPTLAGEDGLPNLPQTVANYSPATPFYNINNPLVVQDSVYGNYDVYAGNGGSGGTGGNWGESGNAGDNGTDGQQQQNTGQGPLVVSGANGASGGSPGNAVEGRSNLDSFVNYGSVYGSIVG